MSIHITIPPRGPCMVGVKRATLYTHTLRFLPLPYALVHFLLLVARVSFCLEQKGHRLTIKANPFGPINIIVTPIVCPLYWLSDGIMAHMNHR